MIKYDRAAKLEMLKSEAIANIEGTSTKEQFDILFEELLDWISNVDVSFSPLIKSYVSEERNLAWLLDNTEDNVFCIQLDRVSLIGRTGSIRVVTDDVEFRIVK